MRVEAILIDTKRPEDLARFYREGLGLGEPKWYGDDHLGVRLENIYLAFERKENPRPGAHSVWFAVKDIEAVHKKMIELGAKPRTAPAWHETAKETIGSVFDPDGNVVGLIEG